MEAGMMEKDRIRTGRLTDERSQEVAEFLSSMEADRWIADADILVDMAHLLMLVRQGLVEKEAARAIMQVLLELQEKGIPAEVFQDRFEDIHAGIEAYLIGRIGEEWGGRLHTGRSRNDEVATCIRIRLRQELAGLMGDLIILRETLLDLAARNEATVMPGFTHLQTAQPTTLAHHLAAYEEAFSRDFERLQAAFGRVNRSPLGAAAFASSGLPIDREITARLLGFTDVLGNTMDAVASRDALLEALSAAGILMTSVSRFCEELVLWSSTLVQFVELDDAYCSTSSIMPQKKNPDTAEIVRAKTGSVCGALSSALLIVKALPMSYNRDLQEVTPHLWRGMDATRRSIRLLNGMVSSARFNRKRLEEESRKGFATATDLADLLVREYGLPFRTAHSIVGRAVREGNLELDTLEKVARELGSISLVGLGLTAEKVLEALSPHSAVTVRDAIGGPSPVAIRAALKDRRRAHRRDDAWHRKITEALATAQSELIAAAKEMAA
jgi:argininosuccinate lyase